VSVVALVAGLAAASALGRAGATVTLTGAVGPGYSISLMKDGKKVRSLKPGSYRLVIADRSSAHDFTIEQERGGRFERHLTGIAFTGTKTVTLSLRAGKWKFYCSAHEASMSGLVNVGTGAAPPTTAATTTTSGYGGYGKGSNYGS
jgi:plastocyanin